MKFFAFTEENVKSMSCHSTIAMICFGVGGFLLNNCIGWIWFMVLFCFGLGIISLFFNRGILKEVKRKSKIVS